MYLHESEGIMWISEAEAQRLTGKSHSTIRRWVRANESKHTHVNSSGEILVEALKEDYKFVERERMQASERTKKSEEIEGMSLANTQTSLQAFSDQMQASERMIEKQQKTIDELIKRKSKVPLWLTIGFIVLILALLSAFTVYTDQMSNFHKKSSSAQSDALNVLINGQEQQIEGLKDLIRAKDHIEKTQANQIDDLSGEVMQLKKEIKHLQNPKPIPLLLE